MRTRLSSRCIAAGLFALACLAPPVAFATSATVDPPVATGPARLAELKVLAITDATVSLDLAVYIPKDEAVLARTDKGNNIAVSSVNTLSTASLEGGTAHCAAELAVASEISVNRTTARSHSPPSIANAENMIIMTNTTGGASTGVLDDRQRLHTARPLIIAKRAAAGLREVPSPDIA